MRLAKVACRFAIAAIIAVEISPALSQDQTADAIQRGRELAQLLCQRCHAIEGAGPGPNKDAPAFQSLIDRLTLEGLADQIIVGLPLGHEPMPKWQFSEQQAEDLLLYIDSVTVPKAN